ncbi:MAG: CRISPR-associated endonuclease Cas1 [Zetaproteobacteria bacterium]|nr:MAG: CRISPR-associated endonuclease Cas1 [Zetaproteobacteria bacterium]
METTVIDQRNARLSIADRRLRIETPNASPRFIPLAMIQRLIVIASVELEARVLTRLAEQGAYLLFLSPRDLRRTAIVAPPFGGNHAVRIAQYKSATNARTSADIARIIVRMKLLAQIRTLRAMTRHHPKTRTALRRLPELNQVLSTCPTIEQIGGIEGGAAAMYFAALAEQFPSSLGFAQRRRRPPPDPVNALLSLGYTLLHFDAVRSLHMAGLDPCIGFLHQPAYNRESLACDCIEPLRPIVDRFVWQLFRRRILRGTHFADQQGACKLGKAGRLIFYREWEAFAPIPRRALRRGTTLLRKHLAAR